MTTSLRARRDKNAVTFFDSRNGTKLRFALGRYKKARIPELVDIKITDYCPFGCAFCYQDSTLDGFHATTQNMEFIIAQLAEHKVFEVALGGGEPTDHPDFLLILRSFREAGIVPNFTTKSLGYVKRNWRYIEPHAGAFAYSCETYKDVVSADRMLTKVPRDRVNLHYVMGLGTPRDFLQFMVAAHDMDFRVTLLGYKTVGRGDQVDHFSYDWWMHVVRMLVSQGRCPTFSIDTPMAEEFADRLPMDKRFFHTREGFVSAYIDAVAMGMSASSFENENLVPFDEHWVKRFRII